MTDGGFRFELPSAVAAAHELKAPLILIRQLTLLLEDESLSASERSKLLVRMKATSERALRLTNNLTKTVRLDDALFALEPVNVRQLVEDVADELRPLYSIHDKQISLTRKTRTPLAVAHRDLLRQVLVNLCDNALNYSSGNVRVSVLRKSDAIRVSVRDYGPQISKSALKSLRLHAPSAISSRPQSSGLGLHISNQFAGAMNAQLGLTQHRDGASFYIDLPISEQLSLL